MNIGLATHTTTPEYALNQLQLADAVDGMFSEQSSDSFATDYFPGESYTIQGWRKVVIVYTGEAYAVTAGGREVSLTDVEALDMIHGKYFPRTCTAR